MDSNLERAIIRTFKKVRESSKKLVDAEVCGLFINFYYAETESHGGLDTRDYGFTTNSEGIPIIYVIRPDRWYYHVIARDLHESLKELSSSDFYALWLRASFEDPKNEYCGDIIVKQVFKDYKGLDNGIHYDKYKIEKDVLDQMEAIQPIGNLSNVKKEAQENETSLRDALGNFEDFFILDEVSKNR